MQQGNRNTPRFHYIVLLITLLPLCCPNHALAQDWTLEDAVVSGDGIYVLTDNGTLMKVTEELEALWEAELSGGIKFHLAPAPEGVTLVGGVLARIDGDGGLLWAKNMSADDAGVLPDGSVVFVSENLLGVIDPKGATIRAYQLLLNGTEETVPGTGIYLEDVVPLGNALIVTGTVSFPGDPKSHILIGAVSLNGSLLWTKVLNTGYYDRIDGAFRSGEHAVIAGVYGGGSDAPWIANYFVLKVSTEGRIEWFNSYTCPHEKDWDAFWAMKVLGVSCGGETCAFGTTTGTFILDGNGNPLIYQNVSGKTAGIIGDSALMLSNGTLLTVPFNRGEGSEKCNSRRTPFKEIPIKVELRPTEFNPPDASLQVHKLQREEDMPKTSPQEKWGGRKTIGAVFIAGMLAGTALVLAGRRS